MKNQLFIPVLFLLLLSAFTLKAQDSTLIKIDNHFALQFQSYGYGYFTEFNGYGFAVKYHFGSLAIRTGFEISRQKGDFDHQYKWQGSLVGKKSSEEVNLSMGLFAEGLYYFNVYKSIAAYTGAGLFIRTQERKYSYPHLQNNYVEESLYENETKEYGINLLIGTEWFVRENIGLSLEYGINFSKYTDSVIRFEDYIDTNGTLRNYKEETESKGTKIVHSPVRLGVAVYF